MIGSVLKQKSFENLLKLRRLDYASGDGCTYVENDDSINSLLANLKFEPKQDKEYTYYSKGAYNVIVIGCEYSEFIVCAIDKRLGHVFKRAKKGLVGVKNPAFCLTAVVNGERLYMYAVESQSALVSVPLKIINSERLERTKENVAWLKEFISSLNLPELFHVDYPKKGERNYAELIVPNSEMVALYYSESDIAIINKM